MVEASFAGALGIGLGGRTVYAHGEEMRPQLGLPGSQDLRAAVRLSRRVQTGTVVVAVGYRLLRAVLSRRRRLSFSRTAASSAQCQGRVRYRLHRWLGHRGGGSARRCALVRTSAPVWRTYVGAWCQFVVVG